MQRRRQGMYRAARRIEQSLADEVRAALPDTSIGFDMPLAEACPAIFAPSPADELALIDASFQALSARCRDTERLRELAEDAASLRKAALERT